MAKQDTLVMVLSGGLDSLTSLYLLKQERPIALALTFNYGQRAFPREAQVSCYHCEKLGIPHKILSLNWLAEYSDSALIRGALPLGDQVNLQKLEVSQKTAQKVWVANRNGVFLSIAASMAEAIGASAVGVGFNAEEATTFPDNSEAFVQSFNQALRYSTRNQVQVLAPTQKLDKVGIVEKARALFPLEQLWSCYQDGDFLCGQCESCQRLARALEAHGISWRDYAAKNQIFIRSLRSL